MPITRKALPFASTLVKRQTPQNGPIKAEVLNDFLDEAHADIVQLGDLVNRLLVDQDRSLQILMRENASLRDRVGELEALDSVRQHFDAENSATLEFVTDFRSLANFETSGFNETRRLRINPLFGQVTVPFNNVRSRFHIVDPRTNDIFIPDSLVANVAEINEAGGTVAAGTPKNAFNGQNESYWKREVTFALSDDIDEVQMQMDVDVPLQFANQANCFSIHPYPLGKVDITEVLYSTDVSEPATALPGFPSGGIKNAEHTRLYFAPLAITKLRIKFKQRDWSEREGQKLFQYGAQEIDLSLIEFDKTDEVSLQNNNAAVIQIDAPEGFQFNQVTNFFSDPAWEVAGSPTGVFFELYADEALTNLRWSSLTDPDPEATPLNLSALTITSMYLLVALKYQTSTQTTPVLGRVGLAYTTQT